ncbi:hypothetical protein F5I97DRAFT_1965293 [Phlebopus sp. FC_14]|nr:hypothetical protein F5I97DRAFT_1965293 [Phlebopus sp. FC_14]
MTLSTSSVSAATRQNRLMRIAAASLPAAGASATALFAVRVSSPAVVFLATLSLLPTKPLSPPSPSPITPVVVQSRIPRKTLILVLLSLAAASFLFDGLAYVTYAILNGVWKSGTGVELASLLGLVAYAGLAAVGAYKDVNNVEVWSRERVKLAIAIALGLDMAQVVLVAVYAKTRGPGGICDGSKVVECIPESLHFITPLLRVIFLVPLLFALFTPRVVYVPAQVQSETVEVENAPLVDQEGDGPSGEGGKYGTFTSQIQVESGPPPPPAEVKTASLKPKRVSSFTILKKSRPYLLPEHASDFKGLFFLTTVLHIITRLLIPLLPLSLGAALNAFLSDSLPPASTPMPFGNSPYPYIISFVVLHFLTSSGGIPALVKAFIHRLGQHADQLLEGRYVDHMLALSVGSTAQTSVTYATGALTKVLTTLSVLIAAVDDVLIGAIVLGVLFGWAFGVAVILVASVYGYATCLVARSTTSHSCLTPAFVLLQALIASGGLLLGSLYIAKGVTEGVWSAGAWAAWVWYWCLLLLPLTWTPSLYVATADARSIFDVLDGPAVVVDSGKATLASADGIEVKFDNVSLTYPYTDVHTPLQAFSGLSFSLPASSVTALVGAPGAGKSSVLKVLYRLYECDADGSISLNGGDICQLSLASLRDAVGIIPSRDRIKAVSRALEKDAKVLLVEGDLMDVPIDGKTVLWEVGDDKLAGVEGVDQILVLKDGQLVESGTFKELLEAQGVFASMWADNLSSKGTGVPVAGSSSIAGSGAIAGYEVEAVEVATPLEGGIHGSPRAVTASLRAPTLTGTASIRAPSIKPTASINTESVAPSVPAKDASAPISFPSSEPEAESASISVAPAPAPVSFPSTDAPAGPLAFPTRGDDTPSIRSGTGSQTHVRMPTTTSIPAHLQNATVTFDTSATPPRVSTPDPTASGSGTQTPDGEGKRKRISSQNFQRLARRISLSTPKKGGGIQGIPGIAGIAGVLRRDSSFKDVKDKSGDGPGSGPGSVRESVDVVGPSGSANTTSAPSPAPDSARNSGEITDKDKEREEKKRKRKSFIQVVGGRKDSEGDA